MVAMVSPIFLLSPKRICVVEGGWVGVGVGRGVLVGMAVRLGTKTVGCGVVGIEVGVKLLVGVGVFARRMSKTWLM